jgi:hypothetical protein
MKAWGGEPLPLPNEVIAIVVLVMAMGLLVRLWWMVATGGLQRFRRSSLFLVVAYVAATSYWSAYAWWNR